MAGLAYNLFVPPSKPKSPKINLPTAKPETEGVDPQRGRQGRALANTDLSGMRRMVGAYQSGKTTLGAG